MHTPSRRVFLQQSAGLGAAMILGSALGKNLAAADAPKQTMKLGLCTYQWGKDCDLPELISLCEKTKVLGVELRVQHKHGVEPTLGAQARAEVKKRFADSPITLVGMGTNECYDSPDAAKLQKSIENTKAFLELSRDCGGSGVKVKPNDFHDGVPHEKTIEQIGKSLNIVGKMAADIGQTIRLEVHGSCCELPVIKQIMDIADHPSVGVCWNCNAGDLRGQGLEYNFNLVKNRFGATCHVRELDPADYPYPQLFELLVKANYTGWMLLECRKTPTDLVAALVEQRGLFDELLAKAQAG
jgi:sugar phosphate isomerase/epimerase